MTKNVLLSINLPLFLLLQMAAIICLKWGSSAPNRYWWGVILGNVITCVSILALVNIYKVLPPATAMAVASGGAFICCQLALLMVFRQQIPATGWGGIVLIFSGILLFAFAKS